MNYIKTFETFNDDNRGEEGEYPDHNPALNLQVKDYVDAILGSNQFKEIFDLVGIEPPVDLQGEEFDKAFDEVKELAIKYFIKNPEEMRQSPEFKKFPVKSDPLPRVQSIGGNVAYR